MPTLRTKEQNKQLHTLLCKLKIDLDTKEDLVAIYTNERTKRSSEMYRSECALLIYDLQKKFTPSQKELLLDQKRKRVISHLAQAGYVTPAGRPDMVAISAWVEKQKFKKRFNDHTAAELSILIYASRQVLKHQLDNS